MTETTLPLVRLEHFYDALAEGVDRAGHGRGELFLAKVALLLARRIAEPRWLDEAIEHALAEHRDPDDPGEPPEDPKPIDPPEDEPGKPSGRA